MLTNICVEKFSSIEILRYWVEKEGLEHNNNILIQVAASLIKMASGRDKQTMDMVPINMRDPFWKDPFFSSTWEEFDKMRSDMMARSKDFWSKVGVRIKKRKQRTGNKKMLFLG